LSSRTGSSSPQETLGSFFINVYPVFHLFSSSSLTLKLDRTGRAYDLAVKDGKIALTAPHIPAEDAAEVIDAEGAYVTPGGVDAHVHLCQDTKPSEHC
jgi:imidazolonepropionase-like amidohydrolase